MSTPFFTLQNFPANFYSRRLLLLPTPAAPSPTHIPPQPYSGNNGFDANVVMVLSVLLCALICSLGLNSIIRCILRCSNLFSTQSISGNSSIRLTNTGVKQKALKTFPLVIYSIESKLPGLDTDCVICLSEFVSGDRLRLLPKCNHGFHVRCIDLWLSSHSSCPTCRYSLIETCQKIIAGGQSSSPELTPVVNDGVTSVVPLEHEGAVCNYRGNSFA